MLVRDSKCKVRLYSAKIAAYVVSAVLSSQKGPECSLGRSQRSQSRTLSCNHTAAKKGWRRGTIASVFGWQTFHDLWLACDYFVASVRYRSSNQANSAFHPFKAYGNGDH